MIIDHDLDHEHHHQHHLHHVMHEVATAEEVHHKVEPLRILEGGVQPCQEPGGRSELISCHLSSQSFSILIPFLIFES